MPEPSQQFEVDVLFDGEHITFSGTNSNNQILVTEPVAIIILSLVSSVQGAAFPSNPIEWIDENGAPISTPSHLSVSREDAVTCIITDSNSVTTDTSHPFFVLVESNNQFFSSDPTIINQPPGGTEG